MEKKPAKNGMREREGADQEDHEGLGHPARETAHPEDVVAADRVDDRTRGEEEERLEDAVGQQVQEARAREPGPDRRHHVAELGDGGVGQHPLDVALHAGEGGREQRGEGADPAHRAQHLGRLLEEERGAEEQVDARGHHRGGVDQGRHRGRSLHRVGQPDVERELGRLARRAQVDAEHDEAEAGEGVAAALGHLEQLGEVEGAGAAPQHHDADEEPHVARLGDPERLHRRARRLGPCVPVADQEVGAEAHQLPADEELDEVGGQHQPHHREREEGLVGVVAAERGRRLVGEVAERVHLHQERHQRDQDQHQGGVGVGEHAHRGEHPVLHRDPLPEDPPRHVRHRGVPREDRGDQGAGGEHDGEHRGRGAGAPQRHDEAQEQEGQAGGEPGPEREVAGRGHGGRYPRRRSR